MKKELNVLRGVLGLARRRGEYPLDPGQVLPPWDANYVPRSRVHTIEEAKKLLAALYDDERRAELAFFYVSGARHAEGKRARPRRDVDLVAGEVHLDGSKTASSTRTVPITPISRPFLELALAGLPEGQEQYRPWQNMRRDVLAACKRAGVPEVSLNDLRRSFATWHLEAGVSNVLVARYLGHTSTQMVDRVYARPSVEALKKLTDEHFASRGAASRTVGPLPEPERPGADEQDAPAEAPVTVPRRRQRGADKPDGAPPLH
ncbi:MAG: site-specific integrase [Labilithrix sp.]